MVEKILGGLVLFGLRKLSKYTTNTVDDKVVSFVELILGNKDLVKATESLTEVVDEIL